MPTCKRKLGIAAMSLALCLAACSGELPPAEEQIRKLNNDAELAVEAKDVKTLKDFVADGYMDERGHDKSALIRLVQLYLLHHKAIYVHTITRSLVIIDEDNAAAEILAAMAGQPVSNPDQLFDMRADLVRFEVSYVRDGDEWQVRNVEWRSATVEDFL